ncbi:Helix-turn-helix domain [uncultured Clostridium sp.]|uniref:helix-turn-helix domain-containing protein n=1 Tax=uncultured Clostridium sp. TaxID=59620 RepID=UPI0008207732|nr:helix-turn-helix domain-containing protein [uncultured Clostridium sp.]SCK01435.1 Helix-turn-helix domain [uncultured Clostridium sp.]
MDNLLSLNKQDIVINKKTLSIKQLQQVLGLGYTKTLEIVNAEGFPRIKVGRRTIIIASKLDEWLENNIGLTI